MRKSFVVTIVLSIMFCTKQSLSAQHSAPNEIQPIKITGEIKFDGILNDSIWTVQ